MEHPLALIGLIWLNLIGDPSLVEADGLFLSLPVDLLEEPKFEKHLTSGLTLSLAVRYDDRRGNTGAVLVEIRFEPWDEVFFVRAGGEKIEPVSLVAEDRSQLEQWLRDPGIPLSRTHSFTRKLEVALSVLPFSASEQERARNWVRVSRERAPPAAEGAASGFDTTTALASILVTGAIKRSSILSYRWVLDVP